MELSYLENLETLRIKLERSIAEGNTKEKQMILTDLKNTCFDAKLDNIWDNTRVISFSDLQCEHNCEECILNGGNYYKSYIKIVC